MSILLLALASAPGAGAAPIHLSEGGFATALASGPAGSVWFAGGSPSRSFSLVGRIGPAGELVEYKLPRRPPETATPLPGIAAGPDGNLWVTQGSDKLLRVTPAGEFSEVKVTSTDNGALVAGTDGALRFTSLQGSVGRLATGGEASSVALPAGSEPTGIAVGPEGALWIAERGANAIARLANDGSITPFPLPNAGSRPNAIALGPDGNLWFTEEGAARIGRITPAGQITEFGVPGTAGTQLISPGPDGDLWYTQRVPGGATGSNYIGSIATDGRTGALACPLDNCLLPISALAVNGSGDLVFATGVEEYGGGGGGHQIRLEQGGYLDVYRPPSLVTELPEQVHLGRNRAVVVPLRCEGGAAATSCSGRVQVRHGGKPFGGIAYQLERGTSGKAVLTLHGRPAKALADNGKVKLRVIAFNKVGEGSSRSVLVRTRLRR